MVVFGKPAPNVKDEVDGFSTWTKEMTSWAVPKTSEGALKETDNPTIFQGSNARAKEVLYFYFWREKVESACRAREGITTAATNSSLLRKFYDIGSPSLAMDELRRTKRLFKQAGIPALIHRRQNGR